MSSRIPFANQVKKPPLRAPSTPAKQIFGSHHGLNSMSIPHLPNSTMLRISTNEPEGNVVTLRLEGQIVGAWTSELGEECERMLAAGHKVVLDLENVSLIDRRALTLLASLSRQAVVLVRCSPFQEEQLRLASLSQPDKTL